MIQFAMPFGFSDESDSAVQSGKRDLRDFYPTPLELVDNALTLCPFVPDLILDPCAGTGNWGIMARARWQQAIIVGADAFFDTPAPDYDHWWNQDFRSLVPNILFDLIVMNPPFSLTQEFIQYGRIHLADHGRMIVLCKINMLCGSDRALYFWPEYGPISVHTLANRPSFSGDGRTGNAEEYILLVFGKESVEEPKLQIGRLWKAEYLARMARSD